MSLNRAHIQYILNQFDAGASPHRILDCLQNSAFLPLLTLATVEQCLYENGRLSITYFRSDYHHDEAQGSYQSSPRLGQRHASNNILLPQPDNQTQSAPGISATTNTQQEVYQVPSANNNNNSASVQTFATEADAVVTNPGGSGPTESWNALADRFVMSAYHMGHSLVDIWARLRSNGYNVTQAEVRESMIRQRLPIAGWSRVRWKKETWLFFFLLFLSGYELEVVDIGMDWWCYDSVPPQPPGKKLHWDEN